MSRIDDLAMAAATAWLEWQPKDGDPVGCPGAVAVAVTEWAEALLPGWHKSVTLPEYEP